MQKFSKICGFKPLSPDDRFVEFARRAQMTTPAACPSKTPTNAFATPFVPASVAALQENRTNNSGLQPMAVHPTQMPPVTTNMMMAGGVAGVDRMGLPPVMFPEDATFHHSASAPVVGMKKLNEEQILQNKVETILREWITICYTPMAQRDPQHALACIVQMVIFPMSNCNII